MSDVVFSLLDWPKWPQKCLLINTHCLSGMVSQVLDSNLDPSVLSLDAFPLCAGFPPTHMQFR